MPGVDAKPEYYSIVATVAQIDPDTNLYYNACPENNRKVGLIHIIKPLILGSRVVDHSLCKAKSRAVQCRQASRRL